VSSGVSFSGGKQQRREADHSPPSSAEVENGGAKPPLSHTSSWRKAQLIMHREMFTLFFYLLYEPEYVIPCLSKLTEEKSCLNTFEFPSCALVPKVLNFNQF
jgi:hypothetical protein